MKSLRIFYAIIVILTIITGLVVRSLTAYFYPVVNLYAGDILYAVMMYYIVSFFIPLKKPGIIAPIALFICYAIEFSQLYQSDWINTIRQTLPGRLMLGSGFLYSDLLAYLLGIIIALILDRYIVSSRIEQI